MLTPQQGVIHRAEWLAMGYVQGQRDLLLRQLERRFNNLPSAVRNRVAHATPPAIESWSERLLDAPSLDAVFAAS
ncbi:MAG: DUF4351 domain-containing protein [Myxococcales bacterium]|nr:DUF4351 domain-containing protein [Myxococcales bacterium]